jgi:Putative F0F1-ATPase subunit Ca2+/Mg2+ transporter
MRADDSLGRAMEAAFTLLAFFGIGYALDRWLGTTPLFMIVFSLLAAIGMFHAWKARYTAQMEELEAQRRDTAGLGCERASASERVTSSGLRGRGTQ